MPFRETLDIDDVDWATRRISSASLVIGLTVSLVQAVTQFQEQTLSFVPKIIGMGVVAILATPWLAAWLAEFTKRMLSGQ